MADRATRYRRSIGAMVAVAALYVVVVMITPHHGASATEINRSGSANQHQAIHHDWTALAVRTTTAIHRESTRVGDSALFGCVAALVVLMARVVPRRRGETSGAQLSRGIHGRAPPLLTST